MVGWFMCVKMFDDQSKKSCKNQKLKTKNQKQKHTIKLIYKGDTFDLPETYQTIDETQDVVLLAKSDNYNMLFKVGDYTYGYQVL